MNFFQAQDKARRNTTRLVLLFSFAVISLILLTNLLLIVTFYYTDPEKSALSLSELVKHVELKDFLAITFGVGLLIFLGSFYKIISLSKGGQAIAEMLGGEIIPQSSQISEERQLLNVVEEMAIASGMPIPTVYILNESSINAFAAGQSQNNAVIGITRGALKNLSRDELQGVIAHEFSHIFNGDMRLNIRLIGVLHGILLIGIIGEYILRSLRYKGSGNKKGNSGGIVLLGLGLIIIGYTGTFFGKWIKAVVSRQREYLADASAVQFTRNKDTIAGALKKIGGLNEGSIITHPSADEYSHAYFAAGVSSFLESMFATHPSLKDRIKQIEPNWNGEYVLPEPIKSETITEKNTGLNPNAKFVVSAAIITATDQIINSIGKINDHDIRYARQIISSIPSNLKNASLNAYSARAVIYCILIKNQNDKEIAWEILNKHADKGVPELSQELYPSIINLEEKLSLPLIELCINTLRELSKKQYIQFKTTITNIITHDQTVEIHEWILQRSVLQQLDEHFSLRKPAIAKHAYLGSVKKSAEVILSLIAYIEHSNEQKANQAFNAGIKEIGAHAFTIISRDELNLDLLNSSLNELMQLKPLLKPKILKACAAIILADGTATTKGLELFRTVASCLDCPVPLLS